MSRNRFLSVSAVTPSSVLIGSGDVPITITGTNFTPSSTVTAGTLQLAITAQSSTSITATIPESGSAYSYSLPVVVENPGTNLEYSNQFTVNFVGTPTIGSMSPSGAAVGSSDLTIQINGSSFTFGTTVLWNGEPLTTTYQYPYQISATIPASYLTTFTNASITVSTPIDYPSSQTAAVSAAAPFSTYLALMNNDLIYNPSDDLLYASVPGNGPSSLANSVVGIDPFTGNIMKQFPVGSQPNRIALSDDGTQLYVGIDGAGAIQADRYGHWERGSAQISLGGGPGLYNPPYTATALAVLPGEPNSVAVFPTNGVLTIYDSGVPRSKDSTGLHRYLFQPEHRFTGVRLVCLHALPVGAAISRDRGFYR